MNKIADKYIIVDPWKIIERGWDPAHSRVSESLFSLGNEYAGVRGFFDEAGCTQTLRGTYFNGIYEVENTAGSAYKGIVNKTHFMVNAVDWLYTLIAVDGAPLADGCDTTVSDFTRVLDMRDGTLTRTFIKTFSGGKKIRFTFLRFLSMVNPEQSFQRIVAEPLNFSGTLTITAGCDFNSIQQSRKKCYWEELRNETDAEQPRVMAQTVTTFQKMFSGFVWNADNVISVQPLNGKKLSGVVCTLQLERERETVFEKKVCTIFDKTKTRKTDEVWQKGSEILEKMKARPFADSLADQKAYWKRVWEQSDIEIDGDDADQQGIRFCIFQMQQTYHGLSPADNIGAKGLTGEAYNGHAFWDTETYCLPFYLYSNEKAAKSLLEFRYTTLPEAKERAKMLDCCGACYPVATLNGEEGCSLWQHASLQFQPSTGVAYGIAHYAAVTGDTDFLYGHGIEMLIEISRFLCSRGSWNNSRTGFGFYAVMGPDEFHMMVNNNCYTNFMAKKTFEYTMKTLAAMKTDTPDAYRAIIAKTSFLEDEQRKITECAEKMIMLFDEKTKLYEQHEGYFGMPHIDINTIPISDFPLYDHWSYDRIYRTDMIKQPDVLMFMFLYRNEFPFAVLQANYEFYEPRTIHESSLSPSVHSILSDDLGKNNEAFQFFGFATRLDLDNYNRNTGEGLHTTSIAAAWVNIVFGFGGMKSDPDSDGVLSLWPKKPDYWKRYTFKIMYRGVPVSIEVDNKDVKICICGTGTAEMTVRIYGREMIVAHEPVSVAVQNISEEQR